MPRCIWRNCWRARRAVEISLVSRDNFFLFTPMLHEIAASDLEITNIVNPLRKLLHKVEVLVGDVNEIDLPSKRVLISRGYGNHPQQIDYDHLVIALGSITNFYDLPGFSELALTMKSLPDAIQLRAKSSNIWKRQIQNVIPRTAVVTYFCGGRRRLRRCRNGCSAK